MKEVTRQLRWAELQRQKYIKSTLNRKGFINRKDIQRKFKVTDRTAQSDLQTFKEKTKNTIEYDLVLKHYKLIGKQ